MKIAIDARWIYREISGIGVYTRALIAEFARMKTEHEFVLIFCDEDLRKRTSDELGLDAVEHISCEMVSYSLFSVRNQVLLPRWLKRHEIDIFHSPNYMIPLCAFPRGERGRIACVVTIHDMIPMIFREQVAKSRKARMYPLFRYLMKQVAERADAILTVSNSSARDIISLLNIPASEEKKVTTVYNGVDPLFVPRVKEGETADLNEAQEKSLLYVGRSDPYKNITVLLRAFYKARKLSDFPLRLVIAGSKDPRYPEPERLCSELKLTEYATWTGYLTPKELLGVYQDADLLVHPSRYEGFGLQIVEAMSCGTPVVCSNAASLPEVAGEAGIMISPDDVDGFSDAILRVVEYPELQRELSRRGLEQASRFSWSKAAKETLAVYESVG